MLITTQTMILRMTTVLERKMTTGTIRQAQQGRGAFAVRSLKKGNKILIKKPVFIATNYTFFNSFTNLSMLLHNISYSFYTNNN